MILGPTSWELSTARKKLEAARTALVEARPLGRRCDQALLGKIDQALDEVEDAIARVDAWIYSGRDADR